MQLAALDRQLEGAGQRRYQAVFLFLQGSRGQQAANDIVRSAVYLARIPELTVDNQLDDLSRSEAGWRALDLDTQGWHLNNGASYLGKLVVDYPERFGKAVLTTNFDPLIEVAIRRAGGACYKTTIQADGNIVQTEGIGCCNVVHLHGYWLGSDTLHTGQQLASPRPHLKDSLSRMMKK